MSNQQTIELKDLNKEALRALQTLNCVCRMYNGNCQECPCGFYARITGTTDSYRYKCSLEIFRPKDLELLNIQPMRLVKPYRPDPGIESDVRIIGSR